MKQLKDKSTIPSKISFPFQKFTHQKHCRLRPLSHSFDSDHNFSFSDGHKGNYIDVAQLFAKALGKTLASLNVNDQKIGFEQERSNLGAESVTLEAKKEAVSKMVTNLCLSQFQMVKENGTCRLLLPFGRLQYRIYT
ncbi:unnamed protein product [Vicia faba]|uniref:Uncharacterized protein n=1 Tax=Vicia faba TaxID=3906 RepID=A0AAV0ZQ60_VICFA|nr:unnamed protein product [Vicia faba]